MGTDSEYAYQKSHEALRDAKLSALILSRMARARGSKLSAGMSFEELEWNRRLILDRDTLSNCKKEIASHLLRQLGFPCPITADDIIEAFYQQLAGRPLGTEGYLRAIEFALYNINRGYSDPEATGNSQRFGEWKPDEPLDDAAQITDVESAMRSIYLSGVAESRLLPEAAWIDSIPIGEYGFTLEVVESKNWNSRTYEATAAISAHASLGAIQEVEALVFPFLGVIVDLVQVLGSRWSDLNSVNPRIVIRECVESLYAERLPGQSNLQRRLAIAVNYLRAASDQNSEAVGYLLTFAAIESLIGEESSGLGVTWQLVNLIPTLLEPEPTKRKTPGKGIADLYRLRSKIAHGTDFSMTDEKLHAARNLAAGVVVGVCLWISHCRRHKLVGEGFNLDGKDHHRLTSLLINSCRENQTIADLPDLSYLLPRR